jgi:hypothetical protein
LLLVARPPGLVVEVGHVVDHGRDRFDRTRKVTTRGLALQHLQCSQHRRHHFGIIAAVAADRTEGALQVITV